MPRAFVAHNSAFQLRANHSFRLKRGEGCDNVPMQQGVNHTLGLSFRFPVDRQISEPNGSLNLWSQTITHLASNWKTLAVIIFKC